MKTRLLSLILAFSAVAVACAKETSVTVEELPAAVAEAVENYFPGSQILQAERDGEGETASYELKIRYREIQLEVDVSGTGQVNDVEMDD